MIIIISMNQKTIVRMLPFTSRKTYHIFPLDFSDFVSFPTFLYFLIGRGYNRRAIDNNTLAHAELAAIRKASRKMNDWRLEDCTIYVTLEPCQMCSGAIVQSRMTRVVVGCMNPKAGCAGSILNLLDMPEFNHQVELTTGVMEEECSQMMKSFFKELREARKKKKTTGKRSRQRKYKRQVTR